MSEDKQSTTTGQENLQPLSHRRILLIMAVIVAVGSFLSIFYISARFGIGFLIGGILSFANYYWLKTSLKNMFAGIVSGEIQRFSAARYFLRYLAFGAVLAVVYLTETVPFGAVISGLLSFALAVLIEGLIRIFTTFFNTKGI